MWRLSMNLPRMWEGTQRIQNYHGSEEDPLILIRGGNPPALGLSGGGVSGKVEQI